MMNYRDNRIRKKLVRVEVRDILLDDPQRLYSILVNSLLSKLKTHSPLRLSAFGARW